jgi:O-antigen/teichoic acid export membrane protein
MALTFVSLFVVVQKQISGPMAVASWGLAWAVALVLMTWRIWHAAPQGIHRAKAVEEPRRWAAEARPFWVYRISLAVLTAAGVVTLEWMRPTSSAVGAFAVAASTAGLVQVLATATNRGYASRLSVLLERKDFEGILHLRLQRLRWLTVPLLVYLAVTFGFTRELLAFFRPEFIDEGVVPLRVLVSVTSLSTVLAMAPTYLKFRRRNRTLYRNVAMAAAVQVVLLMSLVPSLGATGAATAYAVAMCLLYGNLARLAHRELEGLRTSSGDRAQE